MNAEKKYTYRDLKGVKKLWNENFKKLISCKYKTLEHNAYVHREKKLYWEEIKIQKALGIYARCIDRGK